MKLQQINLYYNTKSSLTEQINESEKLLEVYKKALQVAESLQHRKKVNKHFFDKLKELDEKLGGYINAEKGFNTVRLVVFYRTYLNNFSEFRLYFRDKEQFTYTEIKGKLLENIHWINTYIVEDKKKLESLESDTKKLKETIDFIKAQGILKNFSYNRLYDELLSVYNESLA